MNRCFIGDCRVVLRELIAQGVQAQMCVTSPPYWGLRDYGVSGQLGLESTPEEYVSNMVEVFRLVRDALADNGTLWLNLGSSYAGSWGNYHPDSPPGKHGQRLKETARWNRPAYESQEFLPPTANIKGFKPKDMVPIPWMVAMALQQDGWWLRQDIIWSKPNPMPESVRDRCTKAHEYLFLLAKSERYYYDADAIAEPSITGDMARPNGSPGANALDPRGRAAQGNGKERKDKDGLSRNRRSVWTVATQPYGEAHFATFPPALIEPCVLAGSCPTDTVLDPFFGSGTTGQVAQDLGRQWIGIELNPAYAKLQDRRTAQQGMTL